MPFYARSATDGETTATPFRPSACRSMRAQPPTAKQPPLVTYNEALQFVKKDTTLNFIVSALVLIFITHQAWSLYVQRKRRKGDTRSREEEKNRKELIDRGVNCNLDAIDQALDLPPVPYIPYKSPRTSEEDSLRYSQLFYEQMKFRRSVSLFKDQTVPFKVVQNIIKTAGTAPSLSNVQPWTFCVVGDERMKCEIRHVVELNEKKYYAEKIGVEWVQDMELLEKNWQKQHLSDAPFLIVVLKHVFQRNEKGQPQSVYGADISTSIAVGILLTAIHNAGLATITTGARKCDMAIRKLLKRPDNERVAFLLPIGYPSDEATVPDLKRKPIEDIIKLY